MSQKIENFFLKLLAYFMTSRSKLRSESIEEINRGGLYIQFYHMWLSKTKGKYIRVSRTANRLTVKG